MACSITAQITYGGQPRNWENKVTENSIPVYRTETPDYDRLALEDAITDQHKDVPYRFGVEYEVELSMLNSGQWIETNGMKTWQLAISSPGALNMSLRFDAFRIPKGGELFIWSADRKEFIGKLDHRNNHESGILATSLIHGDKIIVEYSIPSNAQDMGEITIGQIVHGYRSFLKSLFVDEGTQQRGPFGTGGACEVNVNCPEGADWQVEKKSVAIIVEGGYGFCTGSLVNNTNNDGTPYFLTANHCTQGANVGNWIFYFNHESSACSGSTGPTSQSISGASLVANNSASDFALLLLDSTPPASFDVQYAGWDATDSEAAVSSAVCIHHPSGDIKKISFENDAPYHDIGNGAQVWWIDDWELGVTEPGSSGSPLFNQNHRIIGQLYGGASACNGSNGNGQYDFYGRFGVSWDNSNNANARLMDWLDPGNTGLLVLDGYPEGFVTLNIDPVASSINNVPTSSCTNIINPTFTLMNHGSQTLTSCTINYQLNSGATQTINWTGSLVQNESEEVALPTMTAANGANTLTVWITNPSGGADENGTNNQVVFNFTASSGTSNNITLEIVLDNFPQEVSWEITNANGNVLYSGGTYADQADGATVTIDACVPNGCYTLTMMDSEGDGICCFYGEGSYTLTSGVGTILAEGGNYGDTESTDFCFSGTNILEQNGMNPVVFPNPASDAVTISTSEPMTGIQVYDASGRLIYRDQPYTKSTTMNTSHLPDGIYQVLTTSGSQQGSTRIVVRH